MTYDKSIFVNCPFDDGYQPLLKTLLFSIIYMGYKPRIALESQDSAEVRISKIIGIIKESRFGIHDLSRIKSTKRGEYFRLNMPFELGLDIGCKTFGGKKFKNKKCLIFEKDRYEYQKALSDISGSDIIAHHNSAETICKEIRNWLTNVAEIPEPPSPTAVWLAWVDFNAWLFGNLSEKGYSKIDIENISIKEIIKYINKWTTA